MPRSEATLNVATICGIISQYLRGKYAKKSRGWSSVRDFVMSSIDRLVAFQQIEVSASLTSFWILPVVQQDGERRRWFCRDACFFLCFQSAQSFNVVLGS